MPCAQGREVANQVFANLGVRSQKGEDGTRMRRRARALTRIPSHQHGDTPLHIAVEKGHEAVVRVLVDAGSDIHAPNTVRRAGEGGGILRAQNMCMFLLAARSTEGWQAATPFEMVVERSISIPERFLKHKPVTAFLKVGESWADVVRVLTGVPCSYETAPR